MPRGRQTVLTAILRRQIAEYMFLAFTDSQISILTGVSAKTIQRARLGEICPDIPRAALKREAVFRRRIWNGKLGWQAPAWMLERLYPTQFSRPEVQLQVNNQIGPQTQNVVILSNKSAIETNSRNKELEAEVTELLHLNGNGMDKN